MAEAIRQVLSLLLALATLLYDSMKYNRRRLEFYTYPFWNTFLFDTLMRRAIATCLIAPQYPLYTSPNDEAEAADKLKTVDDSDGDDHAANVTPNKSRTRAASVRSKSDAMARGVALDFAILLPCPRPRPLYGIVPEFLRPFLKRSVDSFLAKIPAEALSRFAASRALALDIVVLALAEVKKAPTRHAKDLDDLCRDIDDLLSQARRQAQEQALCLFSCIRYSSQDVVVLIAGTGDFYVVRVATRDWAKTRVKNSWQLKNLVRSKTRFDEDEESDDDSDNDDDDDDDDEGIPKLGDPDVRDSREYSNPQTVLENDAKKKRQADERRARYMRKQQKQAASSSGARKAGSSSKASRPSTVSATSAYDELLVHTRKGARFMETRKPAEIFGKRNEWSRVLRMGTPMSDEYQEYLADWIKEHSDAEIKSRTSAMFGDE